MEGHLNDGAGVVGTSPASGTPVAESGRSKTIVFSGVDAAEEDVLPKDAKPASKTHGHQKFQSTVDLEVKTNTTRRRTKENNTVESTRLSSPVLHKRAPAPYDQRNDIDIDKEEEGKASDDIAVSQRRRQQEQQAAPMHGAGVSLEPQETARKRLSRQSYSHHPEGCCFGEGNKHPDGADITLHTVTHREHGGRTSDLSSSGDGHIEEASVHHSSDMHLSAATPACRNIRGDIIDIDGACLDARNAGFHRDDMMGGHIHDNVERRTPRAPSPRFSATKRRDRRRSRPSVAQHRTSRAEGFGGGLTKRVDAVGSNGNGAAGVGLEGGGSVVTTNGNCRTSGEQSNLEAKLQHQDCVAHGNTRAAESHFNPKIVTDAQGITDGQLSSKHTCPRGSPSDATVLGQSAVDSIENGCAVADVVGSMLAVSPPLEAVVAPREHSPPPPPGLRCPTSSFVDRSKGGGNTKANDCFGCNDYRENPSRGSCRENDRRYAGKRGSGQEVIHLAFCSRCQSYQSWRCPVAGRRFVSAKGCTNRISTDKRESGSRQRACGKCGDVFCNVSYYPTK